MKIEFRKVPLNDSEFSLKEDSVEFSGIFCKISSKIAKIESTLSGEITVDCCKCGESFNKMIDEKLDLLLSDGVYKGDNDDEDDRVVIEIDDHIVDFIEIMRSEIESMRSDYHVCDNCTNTEFIEVEY